MPTTIRDLARKVGLSVATVSRALDDYPDIAVETRQRVQETARQIGYVPNQAARQLRRRKADAIGYILPGDTPRFVESYFTEFLAGLSDEVACHSFDLLVSIASPENESERCVYERWVQGHKVDGFILNRLRKDDWRVKYLTDQGIPFSALGSNSTPQVFPQVTIDRQSGLVALMKHLSKGGFQRIACIGGPASLWAQSDHLQGYLLGLEAVGQSVDPLLIRDGDMTSESGYRIGLQLLDLDEPPDAIVCINDETALGALHAAHERGIRVGTDLAIAGFDGVQESKYTDPPLTTLDIPVYEIARQLVRMLQAELNGDSLSERRLLLKPRLLIRQSTGSRATETLTFQESPRLVREGPDKRKDNA